MAVYEYIAADGRQPLMRGTITADTPRQARDELRLRGLTIRSISQSRDEARLALGARARHPSLLLGSRHAPKVVSFVRELATLLGVGIPLLEAIDTLAR